MTQFVSQSNRGWSAFKSSFCAYWYGMVLSHPSNVLSPWPVYVATQQVKARRCITLSLIPCCSSTAGSLLKHYQEKHPEADIPEDVVVATAASSPLVGTSGATTLAALEADFNDSASSVSEMSDEQNSFLDAEVRVLRGAGNVPSGTGMLLWSSRHLLGCCFSSNYF